MTISGLLLEDDDDEVCRSLLLLLREGIAISMSGNTLCSTGAGTYSKYMAVLSLSSSAIATPPTAMWTGIRPVERPPGGTMHVYMSGGGAVVVIVLAAVATVSLGMHPTALGSRTSSAGTSIE